MEGMRPGPRARPAASNTDEGGEESVVAEKTKTKKEVKFRHGMLAFGLLAAVMFGCVVGLGSEPQIPMVAGCAIAGAIAMYLGNSFEEVLDRRLKVMDLTAFTLCRENGLRIIVFDMDTAGNLGKVLAGEKIGTLVKL